MIESSYKPGTIEGKSDWIYWKANRLDILESREEADSYPCSGGLEEIGSALIERTAVQLKIIPSGNGKHKAAIAL